MRRLIIAMATTALLFSQAGASIKEQFLKIISGYMQAPVKISNIQASYRGFDPNGTYEIVSYRVRPSSGRAWFLVKGERARCWVQVRFLVQKPVVVATSFIEKGEEIEPTDVENRLMYIDPSKMGKILSFSEVVGKVATRRIEAGRIIVAGMVKRPILVRRGELVRFLLKEGCMEIEGMAKAMRSGSLGDIVELKNLSSGRIFSGEVIGRGRVMVR